ncbi:MAG TPA: alanine racemase [Cyclobacteriaceae bacterium]|nr:alanine racemase [Cyclobacteriaceae bacterium]
MMQIVRPTLLLDEKKCKANIKFMVDKAKKANVVLRPHFKTHQSHEVGRWFRAQGVTKCTVSSIRMASYFAADGWEDITVAFPTNVLEISEINRLASVCKLNLAFVSPDAIRKLKSGLVRPIQCVIEIDTGYHRTGVDPGDFTRIDGILKEVADNPLITFKGFFCHSGQSYADRSREAIAKTYEVTATQMKSVGDHYRKAYPNLELSMGDTPTCAVVTEFEGINELRPGNFVFYDLMQRVIGSCKNEDIAIVMACPVVAVYPERNEIIVHGGGVHFSKDQLKREDGKSVFGEVVRLTDSGWDATPLPIYAKSLSQEHGVLVAPGGEAEKFKVGDVLGILPVHSCLTADAMGEYRTIDGKLIDMMPKAS